MMGNAIGAHMALLLPTLSNMKNMQAVKLGNAEGDPR